MPSRTGRSPSKGAVAVTSGLMRMLEPQEIAGVIAHELAHIKNRDTLITSIAATAAGAIAMLADIVMWSFIFGGFGGDEEEGGGLGEMAGGLVALDFGPDCGAAHPDGDLASREYSADATGAEILGNPLPLASALEKLEASVGRQPSAVKPAASHLYIVNPVLGRMGSLFRTHPETAKRVAALRALDKQSSLPSQTAFAE